MDHQPTTHATVGTGLLEMHIEGATMVNGMERSQSVIVCQIK